ncbi:hypothetical protein F1880_004885 [Penicillium rolfsii]|nr:hypothetical protein F1880_004885 [Penicillium rolfsii]
MKTWLQIGTLDMIGAMIGVTVLQWHAEYHQGDSANDTIIMFPYLFYVFFNISWVLYIIYTGICVWAFFFVRYGMGT